MPDSKTGADAKRPQLSLVMIAKDEEANLPRALKSAAHWVDEIILVDTGSRDRTKEIARGFGARVYEHPWQKDFSLHRNQAFSYASGSWCLVMDADEELDQANAPLIRQLIKDKEASAFDLEVQNLGPGGEATVLRSTRLLRNLPGLRYERAVHNQLCRQALAARKDCGLRIFHYGYAGDSETMARKHTRRMEMVRNWVGREPDNWEAWFYLAQALTIPPQREADLARALEAGQRSLALARQVGIRPELYQVVYLPLIIALEGSQNFCGQLDLAGLWAKEQPGNPDAHFFRAASLFHLGDWPGLCVAAENYLAALEGLPAYLAGCPPIEMVSPNQKTGLMTLWLLAAGRCGRAGQYAPVFRLLMAQPDGEAACVKALKVLAQSGLTDLAQGLGREMIRVHPEWAWCRRIMADSRADVAAAG